MKNSSKKIQKEKPGKFSDFFLHASEEEKIKVFREVARRANKDQQKIFRKATLKSKS